MRDAHFRLTRAGRPVRPAPLRRLEGEGSPHDYRDVGGRATQEQLPRAVAPGAWTDNPPGHWRRGRAIACSNEPAKKAAG